METFYGLSGIGDLIVTCASVHSRNRKAGYLMGKGYTMEMSSYTYVHIHDKFPFPGNLILS